MAGVHLASRINQRPGESLGGLQLASACGWPAKLQSSTAGVSAGFMPNYRKSANVKANGEK